MRLRPEVMKKPKRIDLTPEELEALLERVESGKLAAGDFEIIRAMAETIAFLSEAVDKKGASIKRLLRTLFGSSEKLEKVFGGERNDSARAEPQDSEDTGDAKPGDDKNGRRKGHGRNGAEEYTGAEKIEILHESLNPGDDCPTEMCKGKVYQCPPAVIVRVRGQAPLQGKIVSLQQLRCNLCGEVFKAQAPEGLGEKKYDKTSASMIALLKYGSGLPFNRLSKLQGNLGIPLPPSTQWDIARDAAGEITAAHEELIRQAAQGRVLHNDDTKAKILEWMGKRKLKRGPPSDSPDRTGIFTSGIVSVGEKQIALFFTGRKHAGENLATVLEKRVRALDAPIQMCDALSRNTPSKFKVLLANCLAHGRRQFVDVSEQFPRECRRVLETLAEVYRVDESAQRDGMSAESRLRLHRERSRPLMINLKLWFREELREKRIEPNSSLGTAVAYMKKHWHELTLFYRRARAPLDNNVCERALKKAILHRKNAYFYKTDAGARVGDLFMSLIYTAELAAENPFDYLNALQRHAAALAEDPEKWLPWHYRQTLEALATTPSPAPPVF